MERIDPGELSLQVKQRMDELFPDSAGPVSGAEAAGGAADYCLAASRRILKSLELKSQLERVREYLNELIRLQGLFARDIHLRTLVQVQTAVCRYLLHHPHRLESRALALLSEGFAGLERFSAVEPMPGADKERQVRALIHAVNTWKRSLRATQAGGQAPAPAGGAVRGFGRTGLRCGAAGRSRCVLPGTGGGHRRV
ncbi:MAG: hypothetical protein EHM15_10655, partial [Desulfobacteraceae bacterium]